MIYDKSKKTVGAGLRITHKRKEVLARHIAKSFHDLPIVFKNDDYLEAVATIVTTPEEGFFVGIMAEGLKNDFAHEKTPTNP